MVVPNSVISGVRSEFIGPTFGYQINRTTDLQNENIRLQNEKLLENVKNSENQSRTLLQLTDADTTNRQAIQQIYTYGDSLQNQQNDMLSRLERMEKLPRELLIDGIDTPTTTGEETLWAIQIRKKEAKKMKMTLCINNRML